MEADERRPFVDTAPVEGVQRVDIDQKMRNAYLSYAMSVITARALPDVRDGLKPVQRRILYAMGDMGLRHDQPRARAPASSARCSASTIPTAIRRCMTPWCAWRRISRCGIPSSTVRATLAPSTAMARRPFATPRRAYRPSARRCSSIWTRIPSITSPISMVRSKSRRCCPPKVPNLLINGVGGIAVGMATNIPPNLGEVVDAVCYLIDHYEQADDVTVDDLLRFIAGPDFPTGGSILGREGIRQAYATGRGRIVVRARLTSRICAVTPPSSSPSCPSR